MSPVVIVMKKHHIIQKKIKKLYVENKSGRCAYEISSVVDATGDCDIVLKALMRTVDHDGGITGIHSPDRQLVGGAVIEMERDVNARIREMCRLKRLAQEAIDRVDEARLREVLELYYIDGYSWDAVAKRMGIDKRWMFRLHGRALLQVKVPEEFSGG